MPTHPHVMCAMNALARSAAELERVVAELESFAGYPGPPCGAQMRTSRRQGSPPWRADVSGVPVLDAPQVHRRPALAWPPPDGWTAACLVNARQLLKHGSKHRASCSLALIRRADLATPLLALTRFRGDPPPPGSYFRRQHILCSCEIRVASATLVRARRAGAGCADVAPRSLPAPHAPQRRRR